MIPILSRGPRRTIALLAAAAIAAALFVISDTPGTQAAYLESDYEEQAEPAPQPPPEPEPQPEPIPRPRPVVDNPTTRLIRAVEVGEPIRWGRLVLFPVTLADANPASDIHSLSTAMARGWVTIEEAKPATVGRAVLVNKSDRLVLVLAGELIKGGRQNRSAQKDLLLLPHSRVAIDLYCVEEGRWEDVDNKFEAARALAPQSVRSGNVAGEAQARVWADVKAFNKSADAADHNHSLLAGLYSKKVQDQLAECRRIVTPKLPDDCVGLVAGHAGRIVAADVFVDKDLFAAYRQMLTDSYAAEQVQWVLRHEGVPRHRWPILPPDPGRDDARAFLRMTLHARYNELPTPGGGDLWRIAHGGISGQGLDYRGQSVHVTLTRATVRPVPPPRPAPMPEPIPRDGRELPQR